MMMMMMMMTSYFCFSITAAIPFCVKIALAATIPTTADIDLSEIYNTKGIRYVECYWHNEINSYQDAKYHCKKKKHIRLLSIQMPSGQITTTTVRCCNDTFVAIRPVSAASTTFSQMQCYFHFRFCHVFNSCLSMHQILIEKNCLILSGFSCIYESDYTGQFSYRCQKCHCAASFDAVALKGEKNLQPQCIFVWDEIMNQKHEWAELVDTAFCFRQHNFAQEGRGPHIASDDRVLLQMTASRFRRRHFASDGRILLRAIAFCFRWPRFALDGRILLWTAAQLVESVWDCCIHFIKKTAFPRAKGWAKWVSERTSERSGGREWSKQSRASERVVWANERTDERVAQYLRLYSCLFQTTVWWSTTFMIDHNSPIKFIIHKMCSASRLNHIITLVVPLPIVS